MSNYYKQSFCQKVQAQIVTEYPAEAMGDLEWDFRHQMFDVFKEILHGRFRIEDQHIIVTKYGKIPLEEMPEIEYYWYKLPKQEVININRILNTAWLVSKKKRKYPADISADITEKEFNEVIEALVAKQLVWAYVLPEEEFRIMKFEVEEEIDPEEEEEDERFTTMVIG
jgi:hypothetical protein